MTEPTIDDLPDTPEGEEKGLREVCHEMIAALHDAGLAEADGSGGPLDDSYYEASLVLPTGQAMTVVFKPVFDLDDGEWFPDNPISNPVEAAKWLRLGHRIDYEPGDSTRYECEIVSDYLIIRNLGMAVLPLDKPWDAISYCNAKNVPVGSWRALRPLLVALGCAAGSPEMVDYDQHREASLRASGHDGRPLDWKDARLGRLVRNAIEAED